MLHHSTSFFLIAYRHSKKSFCYFVTIYRRHITALNCQLSRVLSTNDKTDLKKCGHKKVSLKVVHILNSWWDLLSLKLWTCGGNGWTCSPLTPVNCLPSLEVQFAISGNYKLVFSLQTNRCFTCVAVKICRVIYVILIVLICCAVSEKGIRLPDHLLTYKCSYFSLLCLMFTLLIRRAAVQCNWP